MEIGHLFPIMPEKWIFFKFFGKICSGLRGEMDITKRFGRFIEGSNPSGGTMSEANCTLGARQLIALRKDLNAGA